MTNKFEPASSSLEKADTNNGTWIAWQKKTNRYDPNERFEADHIPTRKGDYYQMLDLINNGYKHRNWNNEYYYRWLENHRLIETCSKRMGLTEWERPRVKGLFHRLPGEKFGTHKEIFAVSACLYVIESDDRDQRRAHPQVRAEDKPCQLRIKNVSEKYNVSEKWLQKAYGRIAEWKRTEDLDSPPTHDKYQ